MMKRICLLCSVAFGSALAVGVAAPVAAEMEVVEPGECDYDEEEMEVMPDTDQAVIKIFEICKKGIYWYEAEDAAGNRFTINQVTWGTVDQGFVDFGDGAGGRYCEWR